MNSNVSISTHDSKVTGRRDQGTVMLAALIMITALMAMSVVTTRRTTIASDHVGRDYQEEQTFQVADGGAHVAEGWLHDLLRANPEPTQADLDNAMPPEVTRFSFPEYTITKLPFQENALITTGQFAGFRADIQPYQIRVRAANVNSSVERTVIMNVNQTWFNMFQYAIFYDGDLELFPRNPSVYVGRIHSNGNIYLGSESTFDIIGSVTAAGHIYNTPKDPSLSYNGKARVLDLDGQWRDLSYDSRDPEWVAKSTEDWDGEVMDSSHGVTAQPFPTPTGLPTHMIIDRGQLSDGNQERALRYYYRAGLRIIDSNTFGNDSLGNLINIPAGVITSQSVMDWREGHLMEMRTFDVALAMANGLIPDNGVIYLSYEHEHAAIRIIHGSVLPAGGLVIASDNPVYVQGDYNTINKQPAAFFCDAFNMYSNNWNDANANKGLIFRNATPTQLNACVVAGDVPTTPGDYSGGAQNLIRLHERWLANAELTYRGSMVCIWESEQATGEFVDGPPVFRENHRNSGFDPDLLDPEFWPDEDFANARILRGSWTTL